jgi:DNA-directed RNA polymerase subunit beta'
VTDNRLVDDVHEIPEDWTIKVENKDEVQSGGILAEKDDQVILAQHNGRVVIDDNGLRVVWESVEEASYEIPAGMRLLVNDGERVNVGDQLTEGSRNPHRILELLGRDAVTQYLLNEVQKVYRPQGQNIHDKHFEVIIRKMLSKVIVTHSGDTELLPSELIDAPIFQETNYQILDEGGEPARAEPVLLGITKASLSTESFLSASSFQHTIRVLAGAAIAGKVDELTGLKENVIIGKLIPAGTGYLAYRDRDEEMEELEGMEDALAETADIDLKTALIDDSIDDDMLAAISAAVADASKTRQITSEVEEDED